MTRIACGFLLLTLGASAAEVVRFDAPARAFTEACPLGNGRLGASVFGGTGQERVVLNETGMWSGSPQDSDRTDAAPALPEIRRLLLAGDNVAAEKLMNARFTSAGAGSGFGSGAKVPFGCYQVLGNLWLDFSGGAEPVQDYRRELDLETAVAHVSYVRGGIHYSEDTLVSAPDQAMVMNLAADRSGSLDFSVRLDRPERAISTADQRGGLVMEGWLDDGRGGRGVHFVARASIEVAGVSARVSWSGGTAQVTGADSAVIRVTAATDIHTFAGRVSSNPGQSSREDLAQAEGLAYPALLARHEADYRRWYDRASLRLGPGGTAGRPAQDRLAAQAAGADDPDLAALYFNFGRYLLISCSRPGGLPANLQGLWADQIQTPWNGDWHLNVNVQMNYWPAEVCHLSDLTEPLFRLIDSLQVPGARTARLYYAAPGWVAHVVTNPWGFTSPAESASWGATSTGSAWLCQHLWDHYLFTRDKSFLEWAYPMLAGSARFYLATLVAEPGHGWLVTAPSNSPENSFHLPDGALVHVCMGSTMDEAILHYLFGACVDAARILGRDPDLVRELEAAQARLAPIRRGPDGRIMEWLQPYAEDDPHHRHVSHLWALYPGDQISPALTPALAEGARQTLDARGDEGTGWGLAFKALLWARLGDGERAWRLLKTELKPARSEQGQNGATAGTFPNLLGSGPPFQIDGNFGGTAAIAEMLLQSREDQIDLMPAVPAAWKDGDVRGFCARGAWVVDFSWRAGRLTSVTVHGDPGRVVQVRHGSGHASVHIPADGAAHVTSLNGK